MTLLDFYRQHLDEISCEGRCVVSVNTTACSVANAAVCA